MSDRAEPVAPAEPAVSPEQASRLLRVGIHGPARPVDELLERLAQPDGADWLQAALSDGPAAALGPPDIALPSGALTFEQLVAIKTASTESASKATARTAGLAAMACYFFAVASGLANFGENICSRSREDLEPILLDLAAVTPETWSDMFVRAAAALSRPH